MKLKISIVALALALMMTTGYQANAQMDGAMGDHMGCKTMMGKEMGAMGGMDGKRQMMMNKMMGDHMGNMDVSPEQQVEIDAIKAKYQDDLQTKETVIDAKMADLDKAWADESTTVGEINLIQGDLQALKGEYQQVKIKMNQEIGAKIGTAMMKDGARGHMKCNGKCDKKLGHKKDCNCKKCDGKKCDGKKCDGKGCNDKSGGRHMMHGSM